MKYWSLVAVVSLTIPNPLLAWTQIPLLLPGGRYAGGSSSVFLLKDRINRDAEELSMLQESPILFHVYDNILEETWSQVVTFDRIDELDIISTSSSSTLYNSGDDLNVCHGDECEQCLIPEEFKIQPIVDILEYLGIKRVNPLQF